MENWDGVGKIRVEGVLIVSKIKVRKDSQIPSFDAIVDVDFEGDDCVGAKDTLLSFGGMFLDDVLKLKDDSPGIKAVKKAIFDYFETSGQIERKRTAMRLVICRCKLVSNQDIEKCVAKGMKTFEEVSAHTFAGTGCGSCIGQVEQIIASALGKL